MRRYSSYSTRSSASRSSQYTPRSIRNREKKTKKTLIRNIVLGVLVIYVVFAWILPALVGGLSGVHKTQAVTANTKPIAESATLAPPVLNIPYEATNSATIKISGYAIPNAKVEIYFDDDIKASSSTDGNGNFSTDDLPLVLGVNNIYGKTIDDKGQASLPSKSIQLTYSNDKPKLDLSSPSDNAQVKGGDKKITVSGTTDPGSNISVNSNTVIVGSDGTFSTDATLNDGDNTISVTATNNVGNTTQISRKVNYSAN